MNDLWVASIPAAIGLGGAALGLGGVIYTQTRADQRADRREAEAAQRLVDQDTVTRQREVEDRWFDDRKVAYIAMLSAARQCMEHLTVYSVLMDFTRERPEIVEKTNLALEELNDAAANFEIVASWEATELLQSLTTKLNLYTFLPKENYEQTKHEAEEVYDRLRRLVRVEIGLDVKDSDSDV